ncbi:LCP family protein [Patulibacter sp. SYSU D01012]|uniref:LCP family protein n=1 Tax=Patulibacter sp. SYSU D01012 TaxID=2817381 RepID=UPI001B314EE8|nr:LCP family protein [Patulibacter sp. SYSU D01012]
MSRPQERLPRPGLRMALGLVVAGLTVTIGVGATVATTIQDEAEILVEALPEETKETKKAREALAGVQAGKPQTILLIGDDARKGEASNQRSDTMILVRLDEDAKVTSMLALPRDLVVAGSGARLNASLGSGPAGLIERLQSLLATPGRPFPIHHYVSIRFTAFSKAVNAFGCFYADIDRRYFNDNNPPAGGGTEPYAAIDVPAGYQRLCGEDSLDYVRFRHLDNDLVREARQSHYLTEARGQIATSSLIFRRNELAKTIFRFVDTDVRSPKRVLSVVKLALEVVGKPTQRVTLETTANPQDEATLLATPTALANAAKTFLDPDEAPQFTKGARPRKATDAASDRAKPKRRRARTAKAKNPGSLQADLAAGRQLVADSDIAGDFDGTVFVPKLAYRGAQYVATHSRGYDIQSKAGKYPWQGYRIVVDLPDAKSGPGQFYGVQGTTWSDPPALDLATDAVRLGGRTFRIEYDGRHIRRLFWQSGGGTYWISNSLNNALSNAEMRALARSVVAVGAGR